MLPQIPEGYFRITIRTETPDYPALSDFLAFLRDFNRLYEFTRTTVERSAPSEIIEFSGKGYAPVGIDDRLFIAEFSKQSPFNAVFLVAAIPAGAAALWALTQVFQTLANFKLNRELIRATIQKLKYEARSHPLFQQADQGHTLELVSRRSRKLNRDMQNSQFAVTSLDIDHVGRQKQAGEEKSELEERN